MDLHPEYSTFTQRRLPSSSDEDQSALLFDSYHLGQFFPSPYISWLREAHRNGTSVAAYPVLQWVESQCNILNDGFYSGLFVYTRFCDLKAHQDPLGKRRVIDQERRKEGISITPPERDNIWATKEQLDTYPPLAFSTPPISLLLLPKSHPARGSLNPRAQRFMPQQKPENYHLLPRVTASIPRLKDPDSVFERTISEFRTLNCGAGYAVERSDARAEIRDASRLAGLRERLLYPIDTSVPVRANSYANVARVRRPSWPMEYRWRQGYGLR